MGTGVFLDCTGLKTVDIHNGCAIIGKYCFQNCTSLTEVIIPESVSEIQENAFYGCSAMTKAIIGDGVTYIGPTAFADCKQLAQLTIGEDVRTIGYRAFYGCKALEEVIIPDYCTKLAVRNSAYDEGEQFRNCVALKKVTLGKRITSMATNVFLGCTALEQIIIKDGCSVIGTKCFDGCNSINVIKNYCTEIPNTANNAFSNYNAKLYVPSSAIDDYKATEPWKNFGVIDDIENAPGDNDNKVATPTISYTNGKLKFECATEGVEFVSEITDADVTKFNSAEVDLTVTYNISVYATLAGMENSDVAKATLCWIDVEPKTEGIEDGVAQVVARAVLMRADNGQITVMGADDGTRISVYSIDGRQMASAVSCDGKANMTVNIKKGGVVIVKIDEKVVKLMMK